MSRWLFTASAAAAMPPMAAAVGTSEDVRNVANYSDPVLHRGADEPDEWAIYRTKEGARESCAVARSKTPNE